MGFSGVWDGHQVEADYAWQKFFDALCHAIASTAPLQPRLAAVVWAVSDLKRKNFSDDDTWLRFQSFLAETTGNAASTTKAAIKATTLQMKDAEAGKCLQLALQIFSDLSAETEG